MTNDFKTNSSLKARLERKERSILDTAFGLTVQLEEMIELDPVAASKTYKCVIQYLQEKNNTKTLFTIQELIDYGYLPS